MTLSPMTSTTLPRLAALCSRGVAVVLTALLLMGIPDASALSSTGPDGPPSLTDHLRTELRADDPDRQNRALSDVVALASCEARCEVTLQSAGDNALRIENESGVGRALDLEALTPDLLTVYRSGPTNGHRLLALSALINIGDEEALERVIDVKSEQPARVEAATNRSLAAHYIEQYPTLAKQAFRTGRLSIEDIRRAQASRTVAAADRMPAQQ